MTWSRSPISSSDPGSARDRGRDQSWLATEPRLGDAVRSLARAMRAGLRRGALAAVASAALALVSVAMLVLIRPAYAPSYVLSVVETSHQPDAVPELKRQLAEYVREAVFTSGALMPLIRRHGLYPRTAGGERVALESFKDNIHIDVYQNYFVEPRTTRDAPRSVRVAVSYHSSDPELALAVTRELGELVVERETSMRQEQAERELRHVSNVAEQRARAVARRRSEIIDKQLEIEGNGAADRRREVELVSLFASLGLAERELERAEKRKTELDLGFALERSGNGLRFEVVDGGSIPRSARPDARKLVALGVVAFGILFPFVAAMIGADAAKGGRA